MDETSVAPYAPLPPEPLLNVDAVAKRLAVSRWSVYRLVATGELPKLRIGGSTRFRVGDVERLIERSAVL